MTTQYIVVGAGALGLASAEALLLQGASVIVIERGAVGRESSWAGGGILSPLCPWDYPEEVTQLALYGAAKFADWAANLHSATGIDPQYEKSGMLVLPAFDKNKAKQWCAQHQVRCQDKENGLLLSDIAQARNPRVLQALRAHVVQLGGQIIEQCEVKEFVAEGDSITQLRTSRGNFIADRYIVAAGAWSKQVLASESGKLDIKPIRGQMLLFKFDTPPLPHIILQDGLYLIPRRDGHLLVGSTLEDVGFDKTTTNAARDMLWHRAGLLLPALQTMPFIKHWAGLRPGSPNNIPTIGKHPRLENLYLNSGHFRYGVTMAPASVEILLNELAGKAQPFDVAAYRWMV
jgi:glycine oxidase